MSIYKRYEFFKRFYPNYLIFIMNNKNNLITFDKDLSIVKIVGLDKIFIGNINYIIVNNLDILKKEKYLENDYFYYFKIDLLVEVIDYIEIYKC